MTTYWTLNKIEYDAKSDILAKLPIKKCFFPFVMKSTFYSSFSNSEQANEVIMFVTVKKSSVQ
jgi:hypothetical protein